MGERKKGRYQVKREQGLVPHHYDRDSRSFNEGAWKNWPCQRDEQKRIVHTATDEQKANGSWAKGDRQILGLVQKPFHKFVHA